MLGSVMVRSEAAVFGRPRRGGFRAASINAERKFVGVGVGVGVGFGLEMSDNPDPLSRFGRAVVDVATGWMRVGAFGWPTTRVSATVHGSSFLPPLEPL